MKRSKTLRIAVPLFVVFFSLNSLYAQVKPVHEEKTQLFSLKDVRITSGQFKDIQDKDHEYLLSLEPDRLLSRFRREAGLTPKAPPYPFWESDDNMMNIGCLSGHILGFYMSSMSMMYETTGDAQILDRLRYVVSELRACQEAQGDGYALAEVAGRNVFEAVVAGDIRASGGSLNGTFEPVYVLNKIMLGLAAIYERCGIEEAKPTLVALADWFGEEVLDKLSHEQIQKLLDCEHGSINESFVDVYRITGDKKYFDWANKLNHEALWIPLSEKRDVLPGIHANTQIPKFTGFTNVYKYGGDEKLYEAAEFFWNLVVDNHTWVNGGNSTGEHFFPPDEFEERVTLYAGPESCNSVNLTRLTEILYRFDGSPKKIDYYERVLYNHILANFDPEEGVAVYYTSMRPGHYRIYGTRYDSFWCCVGTGLEAPAKFGQMIYSREGNDSLFVNMFVPSTLSWKERNVKLIQETSFPDENASKLTIHTEKDENFILNIRNPYWIEDGSLVVKVNGIECPSSAENKNGYVSISNNWKDGDEIAVEFTPKLQVEFLRNSDKYVSFQYGPIVLGTILDVSPLDKSEFRQERKTVADLSVPERTTPVLSGTSEEIAARVSKRESKSHAFDYKDADGETSFSLIPFNRIHFNRYVVYFRHVGDRDEYSKYQARIAARDAEEKKLDDITLDVVFANNPLSEKAHKMEAVKSGAGERPEGRWRDAFNGYVLYNMKVTDERPICLYIVFLANDFGPRTFDVKLDGKVLETINLDQESRGVKTPLFRRVVKVPPDLVRGKKEAAITIRGKRDNYSGGFYEIRVLTPVEGENVPDVYQFDVTTSD